MGSKHAPRSKVASGRAEPPYAARFLGSYYRQQLDGDFHSVSALLTTAPVVGSVRKWPCNGLLVHLPATLSDEMRTPGLWNLDAFAQRLTE